MAGQVSGALSYCVIFWAKVSHSDLNPAAKWYDGDIETNMTNSLS